MYSSYSAISAGCLSRRIHTKILLWNSTRFLCKSSVAKRVCCARRSPRDRFGSRRSDATELSAEAGSRFRDPASIGREEHARYAGCFLAVPSAYFGPAADPTFGSAIPQIEWRGGYSRLPLNIMMMERWAGKWLPRRYGLRSAFVSGARVNVLLAARGAAERALRS